MQDKYTIDRVEYALSEWKYAKDKVPSNESILSRISMSETTIADILETKRPMRTIFVITKKYPMIISLNILGHYYKCFDDKTWHPGDITTNDIFGSRDPAYSNVIMIEEMCHYCFYHTMISLFTKDLNFNIMTNNCQVITGYITETILTISYFIALSLIHI